MILFLIVKQSTVGQFRNGNLLLKKIGCERGPPTIDTCRIVASMGCHRAGQSTVDKNKYFTILVFNQHYTHLDTCPQFHPYNYERVHENRLRSIVSIYVKNSLDS